MKTIMIQVTDEEYKKLAQHKLDCGCSWRSMLFDVIDEDPEPRSQGGRPARHELDNLFQFGKDQVSKSNPQSDMDNLFEFGPAKKNKR